MGDVTTAAGDPMADLAGAMADAIGNRRSAPRSAKSPPRAARQLHPAPGAIMGAIRTVLTTAQKCGGAAGEGTTARVVFQSDGTVARVDVADMCIRAALSRARVEPFLEDAFAAAVPVRRSAP
jgi:hypothetical protein